MSRKTKLKDDAPTSCQYGNLQRAYTYFNEQLFKSELGDCLLTLRSHGKNTLGLFHAEQWTVPDEDTKCHEIALSPAWLRRPLKDVFSTLVHEMAHLWQQDFGKPSRNGYHNREWGNKMKEVGLYPSNTGEPDGKEVGQRMTHYIVEGGPFDVVFDNMPDAIKLPWVGVEPTEKEKKKVTLKVKYACPGCETVAWGKPDLNLTCGDCEEPLEAQ